MKKKIFLFLGIYFSFILLFVIEKLIFMGFYFSIYGKYSFSNLGEVLLHGLKLDASVAGYFTIIPGILLAISVWRRSQFLYQAFKYYFILISLLLSFIYVGDLLLYQYWGFRLDSTPLFYLTTPKEAFASVGFGELLGGILAIGLEFVLFYAFFYFGIIKYCIEKRSYIRRINSVRFKSFQSAVLLIFTAALFFPIRGSLLASTMNVGKVYFSSEMPLNHAAINPCFSFLESVLKSEDFAQLYRFMPDDEAAIVFAELQDQPVTDSIPSLFTTQRPNVVVVLLESFMSAVSEPFGGEAGVTPHLMEWSKEGILFENMYANSFRTDRGIVSVLSGYPAQPTTSIMKYPKKTQALPSIPRSLKEAGYTTRYYYGGDADFTNMRSYLMGQGISDIISQDNFPENARTTSWGVPDHTLFQRAAQDLKQSRKEPFFQVIQTSSSHEPFKVTVQRFSDPYRNAVYYTDSCLNQYLTELRRSPYWKNTVVVLVADHHFGSYQGEPQDDVERRRIPAMWVGGAVRKPFRIEGYASQIDLAATLLAQLGLSHEEFRFSKNVLNPSSPHFAFFTYPDCVGMVTEDSVYVQDNTSGKVLVQRKNEVASGENTAIFAKQADTLKKKSLEIAKSARAFLQTLYDDLDAR